MRMNLWLCIDMFHRGLLLAYSTIDGIIRSETLHSGWR